MFSNTFSAIAFVKSVLSCAEERRPTFEDIIRDYDLETFEKKRKEDKETTSSQYDDNFCFDFSSILSNNQILNSYAEIENEIDYDSTEYYEEKRKQYKEKDISCMSIKELETCKAIDEAEEIQIRKELAKRFGNVIDKNLYKNILKVDRKCFESKLINVILKEASTNKINKNSIREPIFIYRDLKHE